MKRALCLILLSTPFSAMAADDVMHWKMVPEKSSITWSVDYSGKPVQGTFSSFTSDIAFDPAHLDKSAVSVSINTAKITSTDKDAQGSLAGGEWLAAKQYPAAVFKSSSFKHIGGDNYEADGTLTIRDKMVKTVLPFMLKITGHDAVMDGTTILKRLDFGIGTGEWEKTDAVTNDVKVIVHVEAKNNYP